MTIKKHTITTYHDQDNGFDYTFQPVNDEVTVKKLGSKKGYVVGYLVRDDDPQGPDEYADDSIFLVHYHRDFEVTREKVITKNDLANWYRQDFNEYDDEKFPLAETYHIFPVSALIHGGVWLSIGRETNPFDPGGWDTSHVGAVLVSKTEWPETDKAYEAAKSLVDEWNQYLSGDVYGIVFETYNSRKRKTGDHDSCWGYYGYEDSKKEMVSQLEVYKYE